MIKRIIGIFFLVAAVGAVVYYAFVFMQGPTVLIRDNAPWYFPAVLEIEPGTTVTWKNTSSAVHPVMSLEGPVEIHSGHFTDTWGYTFDTPGLYTYICPIHPYMKGVIGVGEKVPEEKIPAWVKKWPPEKVMPPMGTPATPGEGKVWIGAQFEESAGKEKPGVIYAIDARTWSVAHTIRDNRINNPHNFWFVNGKVLATNWFDITILVINPTTGLVEKTVWVGESPAHIHSHNADAIYVTLQGDAGIAILDSEFNIVEKIRAPKGPHGHWMADDGVHMSLASTEKGSMSVWDIRTNEMLFEKMLGEDDHMAQGESGGHTHTLPLMSGITADGAHAFAATSNEGVFYVVDVKKQAVIKSFPIGAGPIQTVPSPDGKYVFVPLSGEGSLAVVATDTWEVVKKIPDIGAGAHGVYFGKKQGGGWYAYVSNKFATWITVIDVASLSVAGYIPLPEDAWGGQGILVVE